jgi:hypothetical protein
MAPQSQYIFYRVQNDTQPSLGFVVYRKPPLGSPTGTAASLVDLTPYTGATLTIQSQATGTTTNTGHTTCNITANPTAGVCTYTLESGDLPDSGGDYLCDLTLTNTSGPETLYSYVRIRTRPRV